MSDSKQSESSQGNPSDVPITGNAVVPYHQGNPASSGESSGTGQAGERDGPQHQNAAASECLSSPFDVGDPVSKHTWYEKLWRILRKHQLSRCQRIELASYLGVELVEVSEPESKPPRRRGRKLYASHVPLYVKAPLEVREWLDDLARVHWITGGRQGLVCRLLDYLRARPALTSEAIDGDVRPGAAGSGGPDVDQSDREEEVRRRFKRPRGCKPGNFPSRDKPGPEKRNP